MVGDSPQLQPNSPQLDRLAALAPESRGLLPLAGPARKNRKLPVDQLKGVIQQLCQSRWLSTSELAALVDRDAEKLRSRFLTAMVREACSTMTNNRFWIRKWTQRSAAFERE